MKDLSTANKAATPPEKGVKLPKRTLPEVNTQVYKNSIGSQAFPGTIGTEELNGCTTIVLVSTGGATLGHFVCLGLEHIEVLHERYISALLAAGRRRCT